ncbi:MAG TPA: adenosine kinase [Allosphingosinicella sp.]|uniref:adenosine kinase n=1 Tax=Allosphingosinicella sp. TaxID=2823234 RepID=UPI002ED916A0
MSEATYDVVAIGNAIVDVIAQADHDFITREGMTAGSMQLLDAEQATGLYGRMGPGREISGGSAANTLAGMAAMGARCGFIGQVANDQLGQVFIHDLRATGVTFEVPAREGEPPTGRCLILVTPDGQRTMNTFLGASHYLPVAALDKGLIASGAILYLEGYMWDPEEPRAAMRSAIITAREAGRRVAFTLSAAFVIARYRADFQALIDDGLIDILFANEEEIVALTEAPDWEAAVTAIENKVPLLVVTRSEHGAVATQNGERIAVPAEPVERVVDTTGAGDLFAAGFLTGQAQGRSVEDSLRMGAIAAAEIISHFGARPEADLKKLVAEKLG